MSQPPCCIEGMVLMWNIILELRSKRNTQGGPSFLLPSGFIFIFFNFVVQVLDHINGGVCTYECMYVHNLCMAYEMYIIWKVAKERLGCLMGNVSPTSRRVGRQKKRDRVLWCNKFCTCWNVSWSNDLPFLGVWHLICHFSCQIWKNLKLEINALNDHDAALFVSDPLEFAFIHHHIIFVRSK